MSNASRVLCILDAFEVKWEVHFRKRSSPLSAQEHSRVQDKDVLLIYMLCFTCAVPPPTEGHGLPGLPGQAHVPPGTAPPAYRAPSAPLQQGSYAVTVQTKTPEIGRPCGGAQASFATTYDYDHDYDFRTSDAMR